MTEKTKSIKGSFHLAIRTVTLVPSTKNVSDVITKAEFDSRIQETKKFLSGLFGGYTRWQTQGGYVINEKDINEKVAFVMAYAQKDVFKKYKKKWISWAKQKKKEWGQDSIGLIIEDDLFYL